MELNRCFVYQHIRLDTNEVFYIGIGKRKGRHSQRKDRNDFWYKVVNKHGFKAEILFYFDTWQEACAKEVELIALHRRVIHGGTLVNMTDGGEGAVGVIMSAETRKKLSIAHMGKKHSLGYKHTEEHKRKRVETMRGVPIGLGKKATDAHKKAISEGLRKLKGLTPEQLKEAYEMHKNGVLIKDIAANLNKCENTIYRNLKRNNLFIYHVEYRRRKPVASTQTFKH